jgi:hypothetical protein
VLVQADLLNSANPNVARLPNLVDNIQQRKLRVDRHAPIHGALMTQAEFTKLLQSLKIPTTPTE